MVKVPVAINLESRRGLLKNDSKFDEEIRGNVARGRYGRDTLKKRENGSKLLEITWHVALGNVPRRWQNVCQRGT